jgi:hypothetical protein
MNEGDESIPFSETWRRKRRSGFRYPSKKELERSRFLRRIAKAGGSKFTSVTKALSYPSALSSEISISNQHECAAGSGGPPLLQPIDELEDDRTEMSVGSTNSDCDYPQRGEQQLHLFVKVLGFGLKAAATSDSVAAYGLNILLCCWSV